MKRLLKEWLPHQLSARTIVDACMSVECRIIYVGNFRPWKETLALASTQNGKYVVPSHVEM